MGNTAFTTLKKHLLEMPKNYKQPGISYTDYETWKDGFVFEALKGNRYGQSFCDTFGILDFILYHENRPENADTYIKAHYLAKS